MFMISSSKGSSCCFWCAICSNRYPPSAITLSVMILSALLGMFQFLAVSSVTARDLVFATSKTSKNVYDLCFYSLKLATPWLFVGMALLESVLC